MDKKYLYKTLALPKEAGEALERIRESLHRELGFRPSASDTVLALVKYWEMTKGTGGDK